MKADRSLAEGCLRLAQAANEAAALSQLRPTRDTMDVLHAGHSALLERLGSFHVSGFINKHCRQNPRP